MTPEDRYTDEEIELLRKQLQEGNRLAKEVAEKRGYKLHPRIATRRAAGQSAPTKEK